LRLELASAGQPAPALVTADGQVRQLRGGGQPLGIFPDAAPAAQHLELSPGDVLFFLTDGVADARSLELGYFADHLADELAALAGRPAGEIAAGMRRRVLEFCDGETRDDMTMLGLRGPGPPDDYRTSNPSLTSDTSAAGRSPPRPGTGSRAATAPARSARATTARARRTPVRRG